MLRASVIAIVLILSAIPAAAQSHVTGAIGFDLIRTDTFDGIGGEDNPGGEALSGAVRAGTQLGSRWGVELELALSSELEHERRNDPRILASVSALAEGTLPVVFPPIDLIFQQRQEHLSVAPALFVVHPVSDAIELRYLGGVAFSRVRRETEYQFVQSGLPPPLDLSIYAPLNATVSYEVGPMAGVEAMIDLTEHLRLVPGLRLQTFSRTWVVRTTVGAAWSF